MPTITFSGLASGIDADAVIKAMTDTRRLAAVPLENQVAANEAENTALEEFNTKLLSLSESLKGFLTLAGGAVSKQGSSSNADAAGVVAGNGASVGTTTIEVTNLAKAATFSFNDRFTDAEAPLAPSLSGTANIDITIGTGDGAETFNIELDNTTTLTQLVTKINEKVAGKAQASILNLGTADAPQYALVINGLESGTEKGTLQVTVAPEISGSVFGTSTLSQAENAVFTIAGLGEVTRSKNKVADLIPGVTLDLKQANVGPVTLSVTQDAEATATNFEKIITAFNELVDYSTKNNTVEREEGKNGATNKYAALAKTDVDDRALDEIRNIISGTISNIPSDTVNTMSDLGLAVQRDGKYAFKRETFIAGVEKSPKSAEALLSQVADRLGTTDGTIAQFTRFQGQIDLASKANDDENANVNEKLTRLELSITSQTELLRRLFTNLETKVGALNSQSSALAGIIAGGFGTGR